ncbi:hypothetical protein ACFQ0I_05520 [Mariniflexile aquimaris]|uniref:DUF7670 domain-containing protein n=1 Tax=Mariniflexile aquimaris TaxID=881009 RepID=A0ABW3BRA2_9FLAO
MKKSVQVYHWLPRIICIIAILFISLFAFDSFNSTLSFWQQWTGFLIHLIPSFILIAILMIAWKWEYIGGILFILIALGFSPIVFKINYNINHSVWLSLGIICMITLPFVLVEILFIKSHRKKNL